MTTIQITAIVHHRPRTQTKTAIILCVIEVRQAKTVAELVASCTDAVNLLLLIRGFTIAPEFRRNAIGIELFAIIIALDALCAQCPLMRPDIIRISALGLAIASTNQENLINLAIIVPIIVREVHLLGSLIYSFHHHRCGIDVFIITFLRAISSQ